MSIVREVTRQTVTHLTTWPGVAARFALRLARPQAERPAPPYVKCAGCHRGGRDDQHVPDPDQYARQAKAAAEARAAGLPEPKPEIETIDAPPVWCGSCGHWYHAIHCYSRHRHT